jgi:hypothetical protein
MEKARAILLPLPLALALALTLFPSLEVWLLCNTNCSLDQCTYDRDSDGSCRRVYAGSGQDYTVKFSCRLDASGRAEGLVPGFLLALSSLFVLSM